jgi:serine/threonine protein kinase
VKSQVDSDEYSEDFKNFFESYRLGKKIGQGHFAQVRAVTECRKRLGKLTESQDKVVKILDLRVNSSDESAKRLTFYAKSEVDVWKRVGDHRNCVKFIDEFFCYEFSFLVMERCSRTLVEYLAAMQHLNERSIGHVFVQMLSAIEHVHAAFVIHRDIKVENFLVGGENGDTLKLCDFGLSVIFPPSGKRRGLRGTAPYMCPEMIRDEWYDGKADMWSFGVTAYVLLFGVFPYASPDDDVFSVRKAIVKGNPPKFRPADRSGGCHSECVLDFVKAFLNRDPNARPSAIDALRMPYMQMISNSNYMPGVDLPSLQPILSSAIEVGAVELHDLPRSLPVDSWLNMLQQHLCGCALPEKQPGHADCAAKVADDMYASEGLSDRSTSFSSSKIDSPYTSGSPSQSGDISMSVPSAYGLQKFSL